MLEIKNAHKTFFTDLGEAREIFKGLNFKAENGDFVTIIGSNGAGKSTLLNLVNGSIIPDEGTIMLNSDTEITKIDRHKRAQWISQVYQNPSQGTAPSMTVLENLSMAKNKGKKFDLTFGLDTKNIDFYKEQLATLGLGLENHLQTKVGMLSGGQRQCLSLIMSTLNHPDILLLDEPLNGLTIAAQQQMLTLLQRLQAAGKTIIMASHNYQQVQAVGERFIIFNSTHQVDADLTRADLDQQPARQAQLMTL